MATDRPFLLDLPGHRGPPQAWGHTIVLDCRRGTSAVYSAWKVPVCKPVK